MKGFVGDIEDQAEDNSDFRRVIYTGKNLQLVLMSLKPGEDIGEEVHKDRDQFFRIETGKGEVLIDARRSKATMPSSCPRAPATTSSIQARSRSASTLSTVLPNTGMEPCMPPRPMPNA